MRLRALGLAQICRRQLHNKLSVRTWHCFLEQSGDGGNQIAILSSLFYFFFAWYIWGVEVNTATVVCHMHMCDKAWLGHYQRWSPSLWKCLNKVPANVVEYTSSGICSRPVDLKDTSSDAHHLQRRNAQYYCKHYQKCYCTTFLVCQLAVPYRSALYQVLHFTGIRHSLKAWEWKAQEDMSEHKYTISFSRGKCLTVYRVNSCFLIELIRSCV